MRQIAEGSLSRTKNEEEFKPVEITDTLLTIAEIGVAIAGFSSLATLLFSRAGRLGRELDTYRFEGMMINSLLVIAFALLPVLFQALTLSLPVNLKLSSCALLLVYGSRGVLITRNTLRFKQEGLNIGLPFYVMTTLLVIVCSVLITNLLMDLGDLAFGFYLVGLAGVLTNACVLFALVFLGALRTTREMQDESHDGEQDEP